MKSLYIFNNLYKFVKRKNIKHSSKRYSQDLVYDVKKIKKYQSFGFTVQ